jgi:hypothetical protein
MSAFLLLTTKVYPLSLTYANMSLVGVHSDFGAMMLSDKPALAKAAAMAKECAAIFANSFVPSYPFSVDSPPRSMVGILLPFLPLLPLPHRFLLPPPRCCEICVQ